MLRAVRALAASRIVAAVVAAAMSGGLRVAAAAAPVAEHRCRCNSLGRPHVCACRHCRAAAASARKAELAKLPPCHRAAAEDALRDEERPGREASTSIGCPCGSTEDGGPPPRSGEEFTVPGRRALGPSEWHVVRRDPGGAGLDSPRVPELPPPDAPGAGR